MPRRPCSCIPPFLRILFLVALGACIPDAARAAPPPRLAGHVLAIPAGATPTAPAADAANAPLTLTLVLRRDDEAGFARHLAEVREPAAVRYRRYPSQVEIADRYGPSRAVYHAVAAWLGSHGLVPIDEAPNRLTLTVRGTRGAAERAFDLRFRDYRLGDRTFHANDVDPALPASLAPHVLAVTGLSDLARAVHLEKAAEDNLKKCIEQNTITFGAVRARNFCVNGDPDKPANGPSGGSSTGSSLVLPPSGRAARLSAALAPTSWDDVDGSGQKVGIVAFDSFLKSDVANFLSLADLPASLVDHVQQVAVNGGASPGPDETEVLLDVIAVMSMAPGATVVVYEAPFVGPGSFQAVFNRMVNDGVTVATNSFAYCEDQTTLADVAGIDAIFQNAALGGMTVFTASGDTGSTCLNGSPSTIAVPAGSPNVTVVGGTRRTIGPGGTYGTETWWDDVAGDVPTGQGGFGTSRFFARPSWQDGLTTATARSIPDVATNADPRYGTLICRGADGCPTGLRYGGTSLAAPLWAGAMALLNHAQGENLGFANPLFYALAGTSAFHSAESMGSDFAHVGLGSPNLNELHRALAGKTVGAVDPAVSSVEVISDVPADGATDGYVVVRLRDANGHSVSGKTVTLAAAPGSDAVVTPPSGVSTVANGAVVFAVKNLTAESVSFTATDTTDGVQLADVPTLEFAVPPAANGGIVAFPSTVPANGFDTAVITVTLQDGLGRPTPGKVVTLAQGNGRSLITAPNPSVTNASGQIAFVVTNTVNETITYTAIDVTDGNVPVPGNAQVVFDFGGGGCLATLTPPAAAGGNELSVWSSAYLAQNFNFGGVNWLGCPGASTPAFGAGAAFVADFRTGDLFKLPATGGTVTSADAIANHSPTIGQLVFGKDGTLYGTRGAPGQILEFDPETGAIKRTVASNVVCPNGLAIDPLSGDLFFTNACTGGGSDNPSIFRVDPTDPTPTVTVYATLPDTPNCGLAFAPNGTLYAVTDCFFNFNAPVVQVAGTDQPQPPAQTTLAGIGSSGAITVAETLPNGAAKSLLVANESGLQLVDIATTPFTTTTLATGTLAAGPVGPDGCFYASANDRLVRVTGPGGSCPFTPTNPSPSIKLSPATVAPAPAQGTAQTFTAAFQFASAPAGTAVFFEVTGANPQLALVRTDASGTAAFTYTAAQPGADTVVATATLAGDDLRSNEARVDWTPGKHVTFLTLNPSPRGGGAGGLVTARASLTDSSADPRVPIAGVTVIFTLGGAQCSAPTDAAGIASCTLPAGAPGIKTLRAAFDGTNDLVPAADEVGFTTVDESPLGAFVSYKATAAKGVAKLVKFGPVTLTDALGALAYDVLKVLGLAAPVNLNGGGYRDAHTFLEAYAVKVAKPGKFVKRTDLGATNACGGLMLTAAKPVALLVPTGFDPSQPAVVPDSSEHAVDHYLCYQVKTQKKRGDGSAASPLPKGAQVDVVDASDPQNTRRFDLRKALWACAPAATSGTPVALAGPTKGTPVPFTPATVENADRGLVCYAATLAKRRIEQASCGLATPGDKGVKIAPAQVKRAPQSGVQVANGFGAGALDAGKATMVCLPSALTVP